jgi:hypothetical protein
MPSPALSFALALVLGISCLTLFIAKDQINAQGSWWSLTLSTGSNSSEPSLGAFKAEDKPPRPAPAAPPSVQGLTQVLANLIDVSYDTPCNIYYTAAEEWAPHRTRNMEKTFRPLWGSRLKPFTAINGMNDSKVREASAKAVSILPIGSRYIGMSRACCCIQWDPEGHCLLSLRTGQRLQVSTTWCFIHTCRFRYGSW